METTFRIIPAFPELLNCWKTARKTTSKQINASLLLTSQDSCLLQEAIEELSEQILANNLVRTSGTESCVNISLRHQRNFVDEFRRMFYTLKNFAGFYNDFKGVVAVDLSDWADDGADEDLEVVLSYLQDTAEDRCYIFYATTDCPDRLKSVLKFYFTLDMYQLQLDMDTQLLPFTVSKLQDVYGVLLGSNATDALKELLQDFTQSEDYRGIGSVNSLCQDISFRLKSRGCQVLDVKFLTEYKKNINSGEARQERPVVGLIK